MASEIPEGYWTRRITNDHDKKANVLLIKNVDKDQNDRDKMKTLLYTWQSMSAFNVENKDQPCRYMFLVDPDGISHLHLSAHHYSDGTSTRVLYEPRTSTIDDHGNLIAPDQSYYISSICFFRFKHAIHGNFFPGRGPKDEPAVTHYDSQEKPTSFKLDTVSPDVFIQPDGTLTYDAETTGNPQHTHKMGALAKEWYDTKKSFPDLEYYNYSHITPEHFEYLGDGKYHLPDIPKP